MRLGFITDSIRDESTGIGTYAQGLIAGISKYIKPSTILEYIDYKKTNFNKKKIKIGEK